MILFSCCLFKLSSKCIHSIFLCRQFCCHQWSFYSTWYVVLNCVWVSILLLHLDLCAISSFILDANVEEKPQSKIRYEKKQSSGLFLIAFGLGLSDNINSIIFCI